MAVSKELPHLRTPLSKEEAQLVFPVPVPLSSVGRVLRVIASESQSYSLTKVSEFSLAKYGVPSLHIITQENCWFFASIIQELLLLHFGAKYEHGELNHPNLLKDRRFTIKSQLLPDFEARLMDVSNPIVRLINLIGSSQLNDAVDLLLGIVNEYRVSPNNNVHSLI